jgi:hypothetical protein
MCFLTAGYHSPNVFKKLVSDEVILRLLPLITFSPHQQTDDNKAVGMLICLQSQKLMTELVKIDEIPFSDLQEIKETIKHLVKSVVESCYNDEQYTEASMFLIIALNDQFYRKQGLENTIIIILSEFKIREVSESIVFLYNRCITVQLKFR